jgi:S-DNA-T family DNA segregation ATPase FtsK/SpoIIIE
VTTVADPQRLRLRLLVDAAGRAPEPVELDAPADATVGAVAEALAHALGVEADAVHEADGTPLALDASLEAAGLREGARLFLGASPEPSAPTRSQTQELVVVGGPSAGRRFPLAEGEHIVGRDPRASIVLDDPALSGEHLRLEVEAGRITVADLGSRNGTLLEGATVTDAEEVPPGAVVRAGRTLLTVSTSEHVADSHKVGREGTIAFNRPPRVHRPLDRAQRPFPAPPDTAQRSRLPLGASLIPLALGIGLYLATKWPMMLLFATLSPLMALSTYLEDRRSGRKGFEQRRREYRERLVRLRDELEAERGRELEARRAEAPSAAVLLRRAQTLDARLWERRPGDPDFLDLRLGSADRPSLLSIQLERGGSPELRGEVDEVASWYATVPSVPVHLPLAELGAAGMCGPTDRVQTLARSLVLQAATLHSPREVEIAAALDDDTAAGWSWLALLPHARSGGAVSRPLVAGPLAARALVEEVARIVEERGELAGEAFGASRRSGWPTLLLVLDESVAPERPLVARALSGAAAAGVAVLWLGRERRDLPGECAGIVELDHASAKLTYTDARSGETLDDVSADGLSVELALEAASALAPVRDTSALQGRGIPDRIALLELLGESAPSAEWIGRRWDARRDALTGPIGVASSGPVEVDLRRDGPHALVAGMTGAGKSELLQTLIASLASAHPPSRLTFLLVDYKGGAAFKECADLPHTVGVVTDLDAHLTRRALASLNAELQRRERVLRDAGAKDLADLERRGPDVAPPSLAIVIDEFATLAKEVPDFIEGVVDVAQRGRSLGVHLVLATQRPGGVVSENIRANTNLRIALRVNEAAESSDVIGVPDAARIPRDRPGRAYARTGHGELAELQTAYAGAVARVARSDRPLHARVLRFETTLSPSTEGPTEGETGLQLLVAAAAGAARERRLERPPSPWLPPLESVVALESLAPSGEPGRVATIGLLDEPTRQRQEPFTIDLEQEGSVLVYGASGSGKTTFMRTLGLSLAERASPDELQIYGLDFATRGLRVLEELPHCGSVVTGDDEERTARLFTFLRTTLERRKALFADRGAFTLSELRRTAPEAATPRILVLLDGYSGFAAAFERVNLGELVDVLPRLVGDGRPLGIHFAISADRRAAVPNALAGIVPAKVVLRMADEDEFLALGVPLAVVRGAQLPPGRGFLAGGLELQVALAGGDPTSEGQAAAVRELAQRLRTEHPRRAPAIEPLPVRVDRLGLPRPDRPLSAVLGLGDAELAPVEVDLSDRHFLVVGPYRGGRSTALATLAASLLESDPGVELHLLSPRRSPLAELDGWTSVAQGVAASEAAAGRLADAVDSARCVVVIDDAEELAEGPGGIALETLVRRGRDHDVRLIVAVERQAAQRAFAGWLRELRKEEHGLLLDPDPDVDGDLLGTRLPRRSSQVLPAGRGYLVRRGAIELVQVAI